MLRRRKHKFSKKNFFYNEFSKYLHGFYFVVIIILFTLMLKFYFDPISVTLDEKFSEVFLFLAPAGASNGWNASANLSIWDDTDIGFIRVSGVKTNFFANYTNVTGSQINDSMGLCEIHYNFTGDYTNWENMIYNLTESGWRANNTFYYKGTHIFEVNCTSGFGNITLNNSFIIDNTVPQILINQGGSFINIDGDEFTPDEWLCVEDSFCIYNFSSNVSDPDINDLLTFGTLTGENTTLTNYTLNTTTGILGINITEDTYTGDKRIELSVRDSESLPQTGILLVNITAVNDPPIFIGLENRSFNRSELFEYIINVSDEEDNVPFDFNISFLNNSFLSCELAPWSTRTDCNLFNDAEYSVNRTYQSDGTSVGGYINISFIADRNDVGVYYINFSVNDSGNPSSLTSRVINFTVLNINEAPYFRYICDNERSTVEDSNFNCYVNVTDIDEENNLTFLANESWFTFYNGSDLINPIGINVSFDTNYNGTAIVNFTPGDSEVGNWFINLSVTDTGSPLLQNSSVFSFFVDNVNDSVILEPINDIVAYTSNYYSIVINASDDDLLIPDKTVYDENLTFSSNHSNVSVSFYQVLSGTNITQGLIQFDPNDLGSGIHYVNISVNDSNGFSIDSDVFQIDVTGNNPPVWDDINLTYILTEDVNFYKNLSENVSDPDIGDSVSFVYFLNNTFPEFSLTTLGIMDFIPIDEDVGNHSVEINASDGVTPVPRIFNFTVNNVDDNPTIDSVTGNNVTIAPVTYNMNTTEDSYVELFFFVGDDDFRIPQKNFYDENLSVNLTIEGPNSSLFSFTKGAFFAPDQRQFFANFVPRKGDVGFYNVTFNVSDVSGLSVTLEFNLTINETDHNPNLMNLTDQETVINGSLYYDINATDLEDGNDSTGLMSFSYVFLGDGLGDFINGNESIFNSTSGELNYTFNKTESGAYHLNISVMDSSGLNDSGDFWIYVYDSPMIVLPDNSFMFNLSEGNESNLTFLVDSNAGLNLTYNFYLNGSLKDSFSYYGNGSYLNWSFTPNYSDETYGLYENLTLFVLTPSFPEFNASRNWRTNISHANDPMSFINNIGDKEAPYAQSIVIDLKQHFSDVDYFDVYYNQSALFNVSSNESTGSGISFSVDANWTLTLSATQALVEILNVTGYDLNSSNDSLTSATSNNFEIRFTEPIIVPQPQPQPRTRAVTQPVSFKLILPDAVSIEEGDRIELPISLVNDGSWVLNGVNLSATIAKDGILRRDVDLSFDVDYFDSIAKGDSENVTLTAVLGTEEPGLYEITVNATVKSPKYHDWGKIFVNVKEVQNFSDRLVFTEELIAKNPECAEIKELVDEARRNFDEGDEISAERILDEAISACREAISQQSIFPSSRFRDKLRDKVFLYLLLITLVLFLGGIMYYIYRRIMIKRAEVATETFEQNIKHRYLRKL